MVFPHHRGVFRISLCIHSLSAVMSIERDFEFKSKLGEG